MWTQPRPLKRRLTEEPVTRLIRQAPFHGRPISAADLPSILVIVSYDADGVVDTRHQRTFRLSAAFGLVVDGTNTEVPAADLEKCCGSGDGTSSGVLVTGVTDVKASNWTRLRQLCGMPTDGPGSSSSSSGGGGGGRRMWMTVVGSQLEAVPLNSAEDWDLVFRGLQTFGIPIGSQVAYRELLLIQKQLLEQQKKQQKQQKQQQEAGREQTGLPPVFAIGFCIHVGMDPVYCRFPEESRNQQKKGRSKS